MTGRPVPERRKDDRVSDGVERDLLQKLKLLGGYFSDSGIQTEILEQQDIVRLCNLVNNPAYNQLDERWADLPYGTDNIGGYGCGPTSMAIVVSSLTDQTVDPPTMAEWAYQNGYWCSGNGSYHSLIPGAAEGFGLQWESISTDDPQAVVDTLASGKLIVALMSKGHFTSSGHFMVLRGVTSEGKILVADPASKKRSEQEWDISIILDEARKGAAAGGPLWAIY